ICWNDGMVYKDTDSNIIMQYWKDDKEHTALAIDQVAKGRKAIVSPFQNYYLDYNYGITPLKTTYNYHHPFNNEGVIGVEAPIWTEYVSAIDRLEYLVYPRLLAVAERGWTKIPNYPDFIKSLHVFQNRLHSMGINGAPLSAVNPFFLKRWLLRLSFYGSVVDKNIIKSFQLLYEYKKKKRLH
ncbi:MAG: family 20 glycosylhydrolase, partial [Bacilli bacterium]|nr:family 20 glycosylhydrolase [Bacilli bacterium]